MNQQINTQLSSIFHPICLPHGRNCLVFTHAAWRRCQQTAFINCIPSVCHTEEPTWTSYSPMQQHCMQREGDSTRCMQREGDSRPCMHPEHCSSSSYKSSNSHLPRQMKTIQSKRPSTKTRPTSTDYYCHQQSTRYGSSVKTTTDHTNQQHEANKRLHWTATDQTNQQQEANKRLPWTARWSSETATMHLSQHW